MAPLVSIVTPTWQRHDLLLNRCIPSVRAQTYPNLEHVIVSDGPDAELRLLLDSLPPDRVPIRFFELGRNWSTYLTNSFCVVPSIVGDFLAQGEFMTSWADDDEGTPDHIQLQVEALEREGADFAFPKVETRSADGRRSCIIGRPVPVCGQITSVLFRTSLIDRSHWQLHEDMVSDWTLFKRWMDAGAKPVFVPKLTFIHYANH